MCSSYLITMLVTEPASSFSASLRVLHLDGYMVCTHCMCAWVQVLECDSARRKLCPNAINYLPSIFWKAVNLFFFIHKHKLELTITNCLFIHLLPLKKGAQQLCDVIKDMTGMIPSRFFKLCWCYLTPLLSLVCLNLFLTYLFLH